MPSPAPAHRWRCWPAPRNRCRRRRPTSRRPPAPRAIAVPTDVNDLSKLPAVIDQTVAELGGLDIVATSAGGGYEWRPWQDMTVDDLEKSFHFNVGVPFELSRLAVPHMLERPGANIINITSITTKWALRGHLVYEVAKAGLNQLTRSLSAELAPKIRVNAILPNAVETPALQQVFEDHPGMRESLNQVIRMRPGGNATGHRQRRALPRVRRGLVGDRRAARGVGRTGGRRRRPIPRPVSQPFRFAVGADAQSGTDWNGIARRAESLGYSTLFVADHYNLPAGNPIYPHQNLAPLTAMAAVAMATTTLRVGARVFCMDYHVPVALVKEAATLDVLSDGRLEFGIGAGWHEAEYASMGLTFDTPGRRLAKLVEVVAMAKAHFAGETINMDGEFVQLHDYEPVPLPVQQPRPPIMIGGGRPRMLRFAGREADIVSLANDIRDPSNPWPPPWNGSDGCATAPVTGSTPWTSRACSCTSSSPTTPTRPSNVSRPGSRTRARRRCATTRSCSSAHSTRCANDSRSVGNGSP